MRYEYLLLPSFALLKSIRARSKGEKRRKASGFRVAYGSDAALTSSTGRVGRPKESNLDIYTALRRLTRANGLNLLNTLATLWGHVRYSICSLRSGKAVKVFSHHTRPQWLFNSDSEHEVFADYAHA